MQTSYLVVMMCMMGVFAIVRVQPFGLMLAPGQSGRQDGAPLGDSSLVFSGSFAGDSDPALIAMVGGLLTYGKVRGFELPGFPLIWLIVGLLHRDAAGPAHAEPATARACAKAVGEQKPTKRSSSKKQPSRPRTETNRAHDRLRVLASFPRAGFWGRLWIGLCCCWWAAASVEPLNRRVLPCAMRSGKPTASRSDDVLLKHPVVGVDGEQAAPTDGDADSCKLSSGPA